MLIVVVVALVAVGTYAVYYFTKSEPIKDKMMEDKQERTEDETMMEKDDTMMKEDTMMKKDDSMTMHYTGSVLAGTSSPLIKYNKSDFDTVFKTDKLIVLYFFANWCPICRVEFPKMEQAFNELTTDKVVGFQVNYNDNETDTDEVNLAREHGVAYQHTKVFIRNGQRIGKYPDSWDKARYLNEINKALGQ